MLTDFNNTLKQVLMRKAPFDPDEVEVSFDCPRREWSAKILKPTVNLYLFDLRENAELRKPGWTVERGQAGGRSGHRRPPVYVDLSYFITTWARNIADEHQLLWRVMTTLMGAPEIEPDLLQGALKEVGPPVKTLTAQYDGVLRNPGEFWGALDNDLKPAVTYTATLAVELDLFREAPLALTRVVQIGDTEGGRRQRDLVEITGAVCTRPARKNAPPQPLAGALVTFPQLGITARSDDEGRYRVDDIPEGTHRVRVVVGDTVSEQELRVPARSYDVEV